jgi:hypothetical protein
MVMEMEMEEAEAMDNPTVDITGEVYEEDGFVKEVKLVLLFYDQSEGDTNHILVHVVCHEPTQFAQTLLHSQNFPISVP